MNLKAVESILENPTLVVGVGPRVATQRKVRRFWPAALMGACLLFGVGMGSPGAEGVAPPSHPATATLIDGVDAELASASTLEVGSVQTPPTTPRLFELHYQDLGKFDSTAGETKERFMKRVATYLASYTATTGWEACGMVQPAFDGSGWRVRLITNGSQIACARIEFAEPGFAVTTESIHSHPPTWKIEVSEQDSRLRPNFRCGDKIGVLPHEFSEQDLKNGAGYLVIPRDRWGVKPHLLYQRGTGGRGFTDLGALKDAPSTPDTALAGVPSQKEKQKNQTLVAISAVEQTALPPSAGGVCKSR